jgi:serine/threonine-protein kinase
MVRGPRPAGQARERLDADTRSYIASGSVFVGGVGRIRMVSSMEGSFIAGRYRLVRRIGEGTMGEVWSAEDERTGQEVAVKLMASALADSAEAKSRFLREARLCARISSTQIAAILDHGVTDEGAPFIVMEHLVGNTLRDRLTEEGFLSVNETSRLLAGLCTALEQAHGAGVVHRDLKPENVFLVGSGDGECVKIIDFGVAKAADFVGSAIAATATGDLLGTPCYMSPEQAQGLKTVDHRADLWALGVIAFECMTGVRPFAAKALGPLVAQILVGPIPVPSQVAPEASIAPEIDAWMTRALARDPAVRFASAKALGDAFAVAARSAEGLATHVDESAVRRAFEAGDLASAMEAAVARLGPEVLRFLSGHLGDPDLADDAFSEFLQRVWSSLPRFEWRSSFRTWAYVIARRAAADVRRVEGRQRRRQMPLTESQFSAVAERVRTATLPLLKTEAKSALARLREELPHEDKMLLVLRGDRELDWKTVACVFLEDEAPGDEELRRESARLRKRYQLIRERLRERAKATGLVDGGRAQPK